MATLQDYLGITKLRDAWPKWKANVIAVNNQVVNHVAGTADKHAAQDITYSGGFAGKLDVNTALDQAKTEIDTIVISASIDPEVAFARESLVKAKTFATIDARFEESEQDLVTHQADTASLRIIAESFPRIVLEVDDTGYVQRAIDSLIDKGGTVYITNPNPQFNTPVILDSRHQGITIKGTGWGRGTTVASPIKIQALTSAFISAISGIYAVNLSNPIRGIEISNLLVMGQTSVHDHLIMLNGVYSGQFNHLYTSGSTVGKDNFQLSNFADITFNDYVTTGSGRNGLNVGDAVLTNSSTSLRMFGGYIKNCRNAGIWGVGAEQMSHVKIIGTILESNGRDGAGAPYAGELGIGCIFDNADDLEINVYAEANVTADVVIGGTTDINSVATVGTGCRSVKVNGYFLGLGVGVNCQEGLKIIKVAGMDVDGHYSQYVYSNIAINDPTKTNVLDLQFGDISIYGAPGAAIRDAAARLTTSTPASGVIVNGKHEYLPSVGGYQGSKITGDYVKLPILTTVQAASIVSPANGMRYFNADYKCTMEYVDDTFYPVGGGRTITYNTAPPATLPVNHGKYIVNMTTSNVVTLPTTSTPNGKVVTVANMGGTGTLTVNGIVLGTRQSKTFIFCSNSGTWAIEL